MDVYFLWFRILVWLHLKDVFYSSGNVSPTTVNQSHREELKNHNVGLHCNLWFKTKACLPIYNSMCRTLLQITHDDDGRGKPAWTATHCWLSQTGHTCSFNMQQVSCWHGLLYNPSHFGKHTLHPVALHSVGLVPIKCFPSCLMDSQYIDQLIPPQYLQAIGVHVYTNISLAPVLHHSIVHASDNCNSCGWGWWGQGTKTTPTSVR